MGASKYGSEVLQRAACAMICAPFSLALYQGMAEQGIALKAIVEQPTYLRSPLGLVAVENQLLWLIQVGVLRREVDGQGITDSFRLTPLGHDLLAKFTEGLATPTWRDRATNWWVRWQSLWSELKY
ncbi:MAG: hypothetical protein SFT94_12280 [Pseudanabaenaceae cyanobacterium bins.68]|nr:hypothetical protein [Pseudanabaenaceae cyanobacterium bins.68]